MASSSPPPPLQPAAPPPPPPPPPSHHDTTLTLALALPPPPPRVSGALSAKPHARVRPSPTGDAAPCTECGKRFPSWKALFGHMRCHPERWWRGITPPPHVRYGDQFTVQEREVVDSLLMLAGARPGAAKGKKSPLGSSSSKECCGTSASPALSPPLPPVRCDDHKCSVCHRGFATGEALGGHMRRHWDRAAGAVVVMFATSGGCSGLPTSVTAAATAMAMATDTALDLNLPPAGSPFRPESDIQGAA